MSFVGLLSFPSTFVGLLRDDLKHSLSFLASDRVSTLHVIMNQEIVELQTPYLVEADALMIWGLRILNAWSSRVRLVIKDTSLGGQANGMCPKD